MSEMIGNRFLLAGRFEEAAEQYESVLHRPGHTLPPQRAEIEMKLVICYTMAGRLVDALALAAAVLEGNPNTPLRLDRHVGGVCRDAAQELRRREDRLTPSVFHASLGVLGLFCHPEQALGSLTQALHDDPLLGEVHRLTQLVERRLEAGHA